MLYSWQSKPQSPYGNDISVKRIHPGAFVDLNFRGERLGFNLGLQFSGGGFYEIYPAKNDTIHRAVGMNMRYAMTSLVLGLNYKLLNKENWQVFAKAGFVYAGIWTDTKVDYNYAPLLPSDSRNSTRSQKSDLLFWMAGIQAERNLYKKDIWLSMQATYNGHPAKSVYYRPSVNLGLTIMLSNILYKDKVKTLNSYPSKR